MGLLKSIFTWWEGATIGTSLGLRGKTKMGEDALGMDEITMTQIMNVARAGDLILIQEDVLFDNYTKLNGQVCHVVK